MTTKIIDFDSKKEQFLKSKQMEEQPSEANAAERLNDFVKCPKCGGYRYTDIYLLRRVTPLENPELNAPAIMPILLYACGNCGKIADTNTTSPTE